MWQRYGKELLGNNRLPPLSNLERDCGLFGDAEHLRLEGSSSPHRVVDWLWKVRIVVQCRMLAVIRDLAVDSSCIPSSLTSFSRTQIQKYVPSPWGYSKQMLSACFSPSTQWDHLVLILFVIEKKRFELVVEFILI